MAYRENIIPCPYGVGTTFRLQVTPPTGKPFGAQVTVTQIHGPFTISPVMKVSLDFAACPQSSDRLTRPHDLPSELVFKVYDRRFALSLRKRYYLQPATYESEATYQQYLASGRAPNGYDAISDEIDSVCTDGLKSCPPMLLEHLVATISDPHFESECAVYQRLKSLQGRDIPTFYGSTQFAHGLSIPGLDPSVPGVLLGVVPGTSFEGINPASIDLDKTINCALRILDICGDLGVLNEDVRLGNFIVKPDGRSAVMLDFAQARLRREDEDDMEWKKAKWGEDEEGCLGYAA
ncbi:hypothetical protein FRC10_002038, partial [Ceratobasidium sp. 414]